jgi:hypothetical protein
MESNWVPYVHHTDSLNVFYEKNNNFHFSFFFDFRFASTHHFVYHFVYHFVLRPLITTFWIGSAWDVLT